VRSRTNGPLTYGGGGLTREPQAGATDNTKRRFRCDTHRVRLGRGQAVFDVACAAIRGWKMFPEPMAELYWPNEALDEGYVVAVLFRGPGFWSLNPCRIVYGVDEDRRFGFAYGTLNGHIESGEESFMIVIDDEDTVWYELTAYSRPNHWLAWLGYPFVRRQQARFRRLSGEAVQRHVQEVMERHG